MDIILEIHHGLVLRPFKPVSYTHLDVYKRQPITYYLLPITYYLLPITYYLLPITYYLLPCLNFAT
ncbi:hypothetical protein QHH03_15175 [Aphanizomenon sp. 202]|nr:hypothetical protein [Aphanizomenon sp. 202]